MPAFTELVFMVSGFLLKFFVISQLGFILLVLLKRTLKNHIHPNTLSSLYRLTLGFSFIVLIGLSLVPDQNFSGGIVKVDAGINRSAITSESISRYYVFSATDSKTSIAERTNLFEVCLGGFVFLSLLGLLYFFFIFLRNWHQMTLLMKSSVKIKSTSKTQVYLANFCSSAFSCWFNFKNLVFIPMSYVATKDLMKVSQIHEVLSRHITHRYKN